MSERQYTVEENTDAATKDKFPFVVMFESTWCGRFRTREQAEMIARVSQQRLEARLKRGA